jgi:hypothetical protein
MAFSPVGLMLNLWDIELEANKEMEIEVYSVNDQYVVWQGDIKLTIEKNGNTVEEYSQNVTIEPLGQKIISFTVTLPADPDDFKIVAGLTNTKGEMAESIRNIKIVHTVEN